MVSFILPTTILCRLNYFYLQKVHFFQNEIKNEAILTPMHCFNFYKEYSNYIQCSLYH